MPKTKSQIKTASAAEDSSLLLNEDASAAGISSSLSPTLGYCKICLNKFTDDEQTSSFVINYCKCRFCLSCLNQYIRQCVENFNVLPIYCPDPKCRLNGFLEPGEIKAILLKHSSTQVVDKTSDSNNNHTQKDEREQFEDETNLSYYKKYLKVSENIEIIRDPNRTYCPVATCENVCQIERPPKDSAAGSSSSSFELQPVKVTCNKCQVEFCSNCLQIEVEPMKSPCKCKKKTKQESSDGTKESAQRVSITTSLLFNFENIKQCPKCGTLFERADGCAQIMCKCCKHTFCFYCLKSLENDFLLKHYTKNGPCQGKLGHSRISLFFHRIRVMAVFSGTILLVVLLSPFVLLLLPCFLLSNRFRGVCYKFLEKYT